MSAGDGSAPEGALDDEAVRRFLDLSVDLMAISDLSTSIIEASASFARIGWDRDDVIGRRVLDLIHPDDLPGAEAELAGILSGEEAVRVTLRLLGGDGTYRWVQGNAIADLDAGRIYFTGADVSARKALEAELELRNADLERSNEELERFAYAAAHDLKAPLARIEMALAAAPDATEQADELLEIARRGATRMRQLIEDLLTYAAVTTGPHAMEPVDLDGVLTDVLGDLASAIEDVGAEIERSPLPTVIGQRALLGQLLQNLVGNSLKFARRDVTAVVRVDSEVSDHGATLRVTDNGIGIDPARRAEVFGVFSRLHPDEHYPGSGIGLATCAKVAARHGGRIWAEDGIDGGTSMRVWLPARRAQAG